MVDDGDGPPKLDCRTTQERDQCPWQHAQRDRGTPVYGMLGLDCWYRGKAGNYMLEELRQAGYDAPGDFYGMGDQERQDDDGPALTSEYCDTLGRWMADHAELFAAMHQADSDGGKAAVDEYRYAAWWLTWIAQAGEGSNVWY